MRIQIQIRMWIRMQRSSCYFLVANGAIGSVVREDAVNEDEDVGDGGCGCGFGCNCGGDGGAAAAAAAADGSGSGGGVR